jgi:hypothetical protein
MRNEGLNFIAGLAVAGLCFFGPAGAGAEGYKNLSSRIIKCAEANSLKKIAVLEFTARGGAGRGDTEYAAEKIGLHLAGSKKTALIERALLDRVLKETRLSSTAGGIADKAGVLQNMLSLDAVVTGTVFPDGERLMVLARLIDLKTGQVLLAVEAEGGRLPQGGLGGNFSDMEPPAVPFPELPGEWRRPDPLALLNGFRDAMADNEPRSCQSRRRQLGRLNSELVEAKARYWAIRMRAPGFSRAGLTRNPGSEIGDAGVKARFYKLLAEYFDGAASGPADPERMTAVFDLLKMEKQVSDECGLN